MQYREQLGIICVFCGPFVLVGVEDHKDGLGRRVYVTAEAMPAISRLVS